MKHTVEGELERMKLERMIFGRYLYVGTGESDAFWNAMTPRRKIMTKRRVLTCVAVGVLLALVLVGVMYVAANGDGEMMPSYEHVETP